MKNLFFKKLYTILLFVSANAALIAQQPQPINLLKLKATHNSYASSGHTNIPFLPDKGNSCPVINTPPPEQIDNYGVWAIELDFSIKNGVLIIGHDGDSGQNDTWADNSWGITLETYLLRIKETRAFKEKYRPIFIRFGKKCWGDSGQLYASDDPNNWFQKLKAMLINVFGTDCIFTRTEQLSTGWPTIRGLGGKIIASTEVEVTNNACGFIAFDLEHLDDVIFWGEPVGIGRVVLSKGDNKSPIVRTNAINSTTPSWTLISQDLHQFDWTFEGTAPPNPVYVVPNAPETYTIVNTFGDDCDDGTDKGKPFTVHQQGTFKLPYDKVQESVNRAYPGWTVLMKAGHYNERLVINKVLTLKADGGTVTIGR